MTTILFARWWEGGALLQQMRGEWLNSFSCLLAFADPDHPDARASRHTIVRLFSLLHVCALEMVSTSLEQSYELIDLQGFDLRHLEYLQMTPDKVKVTLQWLQRIVTEARQNKI